MSLKEILDVLILESKLVIFDEKSEYKKKVMNA